MRAGAIHSTPYDTHTLPLKAVIVSVFLPLRLLGQGGYAIQNLGNVAREVFRETHMLLESIIHAGNILHVVGLLNRDNVGLWSRVALLRYSNGVELTQASVQYGLVGLYFPAWLVTLHSRRFKMDVVLIDISPRRLLCLYNAARQGTAFCLLLRSRHSICDSRFAPADRRRRRYAMESLDGRDPRCSLSQGFCGRHYEGASSS